MDRNSVLAFLLIAIIILLMPEYYKMVYPDAQLSDSTETIINQNSTTQPDKTPPPSLEELEIDNDEEFISFDVQTNLYKATVSNENGGAFTFYELNNYALNDSELVNLIDKSNRQNLGVSFRSIDGDLINLSTGWKTTNQYDISVFSSSKTVSFYKTIENKRISKEITFYPDRYVVDIKTNLSEASDIISQNVASISWPKGFL